jgi:hypothetical protein
MYKEQKTKIVRFFNFIDQETCDKLNAWVDRGVRNKWLDKGISRGSGWVYDKRVTTRAYADRFDYPEIAYEVFDKITEYMGFKNIPKSVNGGGKDGIVVSCTFPGGDVYSHIDPMEPEGRHVLRCNILTRKADSGAKLYINDEHYDVQVGEMHCYLPSNQPHYVTEAEGETSRVMFMFGYQVTEEFWNNFYASKEAFAREKIEKSDVFKQHTFAIELPSIDKVDHVY